MPSRSATDDQVMHRLGQLTETELSTAQAIPADIKCCICSDEDQYDGNEIIACDGCGMCFHLECAGIDAVPSGSYLCLVCQSLAERRFARQAATCILCLRPHDCVGGSLMFKVFCPDKKRGSHRTFLGFAHARCALWSSVSQVDPTKREILIPHAKTKLREHSKKECSLCHVRGGYCRPCAAPGCDKVFHISCALAHRVPMYLREEPGDAGGKVHREIYCFRHMELATRGEHSGMRTEYPLLSGDVTVKSED